MKSTRINQLSKNQTGVASIIVATVFIAIISLIVVSFALLMRREQRQALDKQLSTQAYYAAESGVNDAIKKLDESNGALPSTTDCSDTQDITGPNLLNTPEAKTTCVLLDKEPTSLEYSPIETDKSTIVKLDAVNMTDLQVSWEPSSMPDGHSYVGPDFSQHHLPQSTSTDALSTQVKNSGILRLSLMRVPKSSSITRTDLINDTKTLFLYPSAKTTATTYSATSAGKGGFVDSQCVSSNIPNDCNVTITGLNTSATGFDYYLRLKSIYTPIHATLIATNNTEPTKRLSLKNAQAIIDSTGKSNDVLRRIQVRVPLTTNYRYPEFSLETTDTICKKIQIGQNSGNVTDGCQTGGATPPPATPPPAATPPPPPPVASRPAYCVVSYDPIKAISEPLGIWDSMKATYDSIYPGCA